jgi:hypothetical protein
VGRDRIARSDRDRAVERACLSRGISDPESWAAVARSYEVTYRYFAPFVAWITDRILTDLHAEVARDPPTKVAFIGRDGHSLATAAQQLDLHFYRDHCSEVVLSRLLVETALQDLEQHAGRTFPRLAGFRDVSEEVDPAHMRWAERSLTGYLWTSKLPVYRPGSRVIVVDTGFRGSIQEMLAALYPEVGFEGRYACFGESSLDPHPGSKRGYWLHAAADPLHPPGQPSLAAGQDRATDLDRAFARDELLAAIEDLLSGPLTSPRRFAAGRPVQYPLRLEPDPLDGLNPERVAVPFRGPAVREATKEVNLVAVEDYTKWVGIAAAEGAAVRDLLRVNGELLPAALRAIRARPADHPELAEVVDSFVRRPDKWAVRRMDAAMRGSALPAAWVRAIWRHFDRLESLSERTGYAAEIERMAPQMAVARRNQERGRLPSEGEPTEIDDRTLRIDDPHDRPGGRRRQR